MQNSTLPKVSVLIPAYNEEKYIIRTLTAIYQQDYPNFEVIVADNHSTDTTAQLVNQFISEHSKQGPSIKMVYENRQGTNFARESARLVSTGSVIAQLDADCIPSSNWISKGVSQLYGKKRVAVTGPYDYFDGEQWMRLLSLFSQKLLYPLINRLVQFSNRGAILIGGNALIRSDALTKAGGYNTDLTFYGDDIDLGKKLSKFGRVVYAPGLVQASSSRRYKAGGFWKVNKKYQTSFWDLVWNKNILLSTVETEHPR